MSPTLQLTISDVAFGGKGVARHEGKVYFVPFTAPGDVVTVRVVREKKNFAEAEVVSIDTPAADRVEPLCPYFGRCGGCAYQHLAYSRQLELKQRQVEQTLRRVGRLNNVPMRPIVASPEDYYYRNRIRVHAEAGLVGFYSHSSHALVDIAECPISEPRVNDALHDLRQHAVQDGDYTLTARDRSVFFEQTNDAVAEKMLEVVRKAIRPGQQVLVDAYSGAGLFAKHLADLFERVIGIEENVYAVEHARYGATEKERYIAGDVSIHLGDVLSGIDPLRTSVILDPPATGTSARVTDLLLGSRPAQIIYVSCNPATLARDLAALSGGYEIIAVTPLDMFPQTAEIETVVELTLRS
ncbi:class I SAM-dependent RNA methyltransferase [Verrucomicrobiota bacterium sgz303538]